MQDPSIPVSKKGVLTSFLTGQPMPIPEKDNVLHFFSMCNNVGSVNLRVYGQYINNNKIDNCILS